MDEVELKGVDDMFERDDRGRGAGAPGTGRRAEVQAGHDPRHAATPTGRSTSSSRPRSSSTSPRIEQAVSGAGAHHWRPAASLAVTVPPLGWPEKHLLDALSDEYHANEGGHIRIYKASELDAKLRAEGLVHTHTHHAHGLHAPYWWIKCAVGVERDQHPAVRAYHQLLVWDMMKAPRTTRVAEKLLDPVLGKSVALYYTKPLAV